jgi:hypothetical protein
MALTFEYGPLQPSFEMPIRIASLAHTMIQMPTCFKMFKRMLLYYKRCGRGIKIPALETFRWPNARELGHLRDMAIRLQVHAKKTKKKSKV